MEEVRPGSDGSDYSDAGDRALNEVILQNHQNLRFSNFLITISTNTAPESEFERGVLAEWLRRVAEEIFDDWDVINGVVLKPAGSDNSAALTLGDDHQVVSIRSRISLERGEDKGFYHMHVLLEVAHTYVEANGFSNHIGVHVNVSTLRSFLNARVHRMATAGLDLHRLPAKIYVNSRLLTKQSDNSAKWLTLQYLNKTAGDRFDARGVDIVAQREAGSVQDKDIRVGMLNPDEETELNEQDTGYTSPPNSPAPVPVAPRIIDQRPRAAAAPVAPGMNVVTSTANVQGLPRLRRAPKKFAPG